eukprot:g27245.t1
MVVLILTAFCAIVPLDLTQLIFTCLGAFCYYIVQQLQRSMAVPISGKKLKTSLPEEKGYHAPESREVRKRRPAAPTRKQQQSPRGAHVDARALPATVPIVPPSFKGESLEEELLTQIMPTAASQRGVDCLAEAIRVMLASSLPEVEVLGFASSDLSRGRANGVAVPDVDVVINVRPDCVTSKLPPKQSADRMMQKWALRVCADRLVSGGFKFRRSGFRGNEPKMTLLAVPIDISVNAVTPLHSAALLAECGNLNPQSKEGAHRICHAPKGHLSPYIWSLLVVYYLQVGRKEGPQLPPVKEFQAISNLLPNQGKTKTWNPKESERAAVCIFHSLDISLGTMVLKHTKANELAHWKTGAVCRLRHFYHNFAWKQEAIGVLQGLRGPMPLSLPIHIIEHEEQKTTELPPGGQDPFAPKKNLGSCMTWWSFRRMKEELARANDLLDRDTSLAKLLEPWAPETPETPDA